MKIKISWLLYILLGLTYIMIFYELKNVIDIKNGIELGGTGLPEESLSNKKAISDPKYKTSQTKAIQNRIIFLGVYMFKLALYAFLLTVFVLKNGRKYVYEMSTHYLNFLSEPDLAYSYVFTLPFTSKLTWEYIVVDVFKESSTFLKIIVSAIMLFFFIPLAMFVILRLLETLGFKFIVSFYVAFMLAEASDIFSVDEPDLTKMEKFSPNELSDDVRMMIYDRNLEDKLYKEITPSKDTNAALVSFGNSERIEVYGPVDDFKKAEEEAIIIHELAHSINKSLLKKISVNFILIIAEMIILVILYVKTSNEYACEHVTKNSTFLVLAGFYFCIIRPILMCCYNITSQISELSSDALTTEHNRSKILGDVLYKIAIDGKEMFYTTMPYSILRSTHPSLYLRVEKLYGNKRLF